MKRPLPFLAVFALFACQTGAACAQAVEGWGTIKGNIVWIGNDVPPQGPLKLDPKKYPTLPACLAANKGEPPPDEKWVVNKDDKGIRDVFVWLAPADDNPLPIHPDLKEIKEKKVELDQPVCCFIPRAIAMRVGQILLVKNSAPFQHNFNYMGKGKNGGNILLPADGQFPIQVEATRIPFTFKCDLHPWMKGFVGVFTHPYFAVTDANGAFEIKNAPAGKFRLMIWHGEAGWKGGADGRSGTPVEIRAGGVADLGRIESFKE